MAIQHAIVRCLVISGPHPVITDATEHMPKIHDYVPGSATEGWMNWPHPGANNQYIYVWADSTTWAPDIVTDSDIEIISPRSASLTALNAWLDSPATGRKISDFEPYLVPLDWATGSSSWRDVFRHASCQMTNLQRLRGRGEDAVIAACQGDIEADLSTAEQADVDNWLTSESKPARPSDKRRDVLNHLSDNEPPMSLGPLTF